MTDPAELVKREHWLARGAALMIAPTNAPIVQAYAEGAMAALAAQQDAREAVIDHAKAVVATVEANGDAAAWLPPLGKLIVAVRRIEGRSGLEQSRIPTEAEGQSS